MQLQQNASADSALYYVASRCVHCYRPIAAFGIDVAGVVYCDQHCKAADESLRRRVWQAAADRVRVESTAPARPPTPAEDATPQKSGRATRLGLQLIGAPVPVVALLYVLRHYF